MVNPSLSIVIIGKDAGQKLQSCVASVRAAETPGLQKIIYVDSQSRDGSAAWAREAGLHVLELTEGPLSAARARNLGFAACDTDLILFLDADMNLRSRWPAKAIKLFDYEYIAAVFGLIKEMNPRQSIYNRVVDLDAYRPAGTAEFCGGNAMMRRSVLVTVDGFDESLESGEDLELCSRIRSKGGVIFNNGEVLAGHDLELKSFRQYWKRHSNLGWILAEVSTRFARNELPILARETRHNLLHVFTLAGLLMILVAAIASRISWLSITSLAVLTFFMLRTIILASVRSHDPLTRLLYGVHAHFAQIPIAYGQFRYHLSGRRSSTS